MNMQNKCEDIDECANGDKCSNGVCMNLPGEFTCQCPIGFEFHEWNDHCMDINECITKQHNCFSKDTICRNTEGSFECSCQQNYDIDPKTGDCESLKVWHGDLNVAEWKAGGGFRTKFDGTPLHFYNMFDDDKETFWLGELDSHGQVTSTNNLEVTFSTEVLFYKIELLSRPWGKQFMLGTYQNLCVLVDYVPIMCTPANFDVDVGQVITLAAGEVPATIIQLEFQSGVPAQIADFKIYYTGENECMESSHDCNVHATCVDKAIGFTCVCMEGFYGDGLICTGNQYYRNYNHHNLAC